MFTRHQVSVENLNAFCWAPVRRSLAVNCCTSAVPLLLLPAYPILLQDRRWRNMSCAVDQLKAQRKEPHTGQEWLDLLRHYGFGPVNRLSGAQKGSPMRFDQFMAACGGVSMKDVYPAKGERDAPTKCEGCRQHGEVTAGTAAFLGLAHYRLHD